MSDLWTVVEDGTAQGPTVYVEMAGGGVWTLQALWSDEEGVVVSLDHTGEAILNAAALPRLREVTDQLLALEPPVTREEAKL